MDGYCEDALTNKKKILKDKDIIEFILARCITEMEGVAGTVTKEDVVEMYNADRTYALISIRQLSLGNDYKVKLTCHNCSKINVIDIDLQKHILDTTGKKYDKETGKYEPKPFERELIIEIPTSIDGTVKTKFKIIQSTGVEEKMIAERNLADDDSSNITNRIQVLCQGYLDEKKNKYVRFTKDQLLQMPSRVLEPLRTAIEDMDGSPDIKVEGICGSCGSQVMGGLIEKGFFLLEM